MTAEHLAENPAHYVAEAANKLGPPMIIGFKGYLGRKNPAGMSADMYADRI